MNTIESLYIHFPLCRHLCNYCDFYKTAPSDNERASEITSFHEYLTKSFKELSSLLDKEKLKWSPLKTLYIGGGTPSLWGEPGEKFLKSLLACKMQGLAEDCEATLEVNPGAWTEKGIEKFIELGFNRFSLGVQSTEDSFLKIIDRLHRKDEVYKTLRYFNKLNLNFSVDFMLGLPFSKELKRNIIGELKDILSFSPVHISLYILTVKDNYLHYKDLPDDEWVEKEFLEVSDFLRSQGFIHYEVSNFALPGNESRHNKKYWKGETIGALGPSATGYLSGSRTRFKWKPQSAEMDLEILSESEEKMEKFYLALRTIEGPKLSLFYEKGLDQTLKVAKGWVERGLASLSDDSVRLTPKGYLVLDTLMDEIFMATK